MNFVADESVEQLVIDRLRADAHDVYSIDELAPGALDEFVLSIAASQQRLLITSDKDFGELVFRLGRANQGVVLLRLVGLSNELKADSVSEALRLHGSEFPGAFVVIEPGRIRIRKQ